jgi:hypothetical protein
MFQIFHLFQTNVTSVLSGCCKSRSRCCIYMHVASICLVFLGVSYVCLQMFHLDVVYVCNGFQMFFKRFHKCFRCLFKVFHLSFFSMLQLLHLDISKVDCVLHMGCAWEAAGDMLPRDPMR